MMEPTSLGLDWLVWAVLFIGVPAAIGFLIGASWLDILKAFAVLALLCCLLGFPNGQNWDQRLMWAAILWMVCCIPGIPMILLLMRLAGLR